MSVRDHYWREAILPIYRSLKSFSFGGRGGGVAHGQDCYDIWTGLKSDSSLISIFLCWESSDQSELVRDLTWEKPFSNYMGSSRRWGPNTRPRFVFSQHFSLSPPLQGLTRRIPKMFSIYWITYTCHVTVGISNTSMIFFLFLNETYLK